MQGSSDERQRKIAVGVHKVRSQTEEDSRFSVRGTAEEN